MGSRKYSAGEEKVGSRWGEKLEEVRPGIKRIRSMSGIAIPECEGRGGGSVGGEGYGGTLPVQ